MDILSTFQILEKYYQPTMLEQLGNYTPFQMLVMTLLSARTKDSTVIPIVKKFFAKFPRVEDVAELSQEELEKWFFKMGFYKTKSKHVKLLCQKLIDEYDSIVPDTLEELTSLPGVGRKTANCILAYTFKKPAIAVDIHVHRIANRLGWVHTQKESETEQELIKLISKNQWINVNRLLVGHGQTICAPIKPRCTECSIVTYCNYKKKIL